jgi:hypothetical protein
MTGTDTRRQALSTRSPRRLARAGVAALLALAAPAVSFLPALTTSIHGSGAAVTFPNGYPLMLTVTIAVTAVACALGALVAGRAALVALVPGLALWFIIGLAVTVAGAMLAHHAQLLEWGIALMAAAMAGAAAGLPLAARR